MTEIRTVIHSFTKYKYQCYAIDTLSGLGLGGLVSVTCLGLEPFGLGLSLCLVISLTSLLLLHMC